MIYLDFQATSPIDGAVVETMLPWLGSRVGNPHSTTHDFGKAAHDAIERARAQIADLVNADPDEIFFTSGATEATNIALRGLLADAKAHVITSAIEHSCVRETLDDLRRRGNSVTEIPVGTEGVLDADDLARAFTRKTALVTVMTANNEIGTLQPIDEIGALCGDAGVVLHTDAAQSIGKIHMDVRRSNVGLMSISGHKLYGPQGIGALYCRRDLFDRLRPIMTGGGQERGLRPGTVPTALCVGFGTACAIAKDQMEDDARHCIGLRTLLMKRLSFSLEGFQVNGSLDSRLPGNLNLLIEGVDAEALLSRMPDVAMSTGSACSSASIEPSHVLLAMGLTREQAESSIRIGFGRGTTEQEIEAAVARLAGEVRSLRLAALSPTVKRGVAKRVAR